jgi:hypothetical protein
LKEEISKIKRKNIYENNLDIEVLSDNQRAQNKNFTPEEKARSLDEDNDEEEEKLTPSIKIMNFNQQLNSPPLVFIVPNSIAAPIAHLPKVSRII